MSACLDVATLTRMIPGTSFTILPLGDAAPLAEVVSCELGDMSIWIGRSMPLLSFGRCAPDRASLFLPMSGQGRMILHGRRLERHDIAFGPAGGLLDGASHGESEWAVVTMPSGIARRLLFPEGRAWTLRDGRHYALRTDPGAWTGASTLLRSFREILLEEPAVFDTPEPRRALRDSLFEVFREMLAGSPNVGPAQVLRTSESRRLVINRCEAYFTAHPDRAVSLAAVSEGLGISLARLRAVYSASFGVDPSVFLKLRRLALVRSTLKPSTDRGATGGGHRAAHGLDRLRS